jgi:hypothetical protein
MSLAGIGWQTSSLRRRPRNTHLGERRGKRGVGIIWHIEVSGIFSRKKREK